MTPSEFGRYRVVEPIADGGFATVYLAEDPALAVQVAVKVLRPDLADDVDIRARFISEARLMRQLAAPSLVTVHDISEHDGLPFFVMEYCQSGGPRSSSIITQVSPTDRGRELVQHEGSSEPVTATGPSSTAGHASCFTPMGTTGIATNPAPKRDTRLPLK